MCIVSRKMAIAGTIVRVVSIIKMKYLRICPERAGKVALVTKKSNDLP